MSEQRRHWATPRVRREARARGRVPLSRCLTLAGLILACGGLWQWRGPSGAQLLGDLARQYFSTADLSDPAAVGQRMAAEAIPVLGWLATTLLGMALAAAVAGGWQTRGGIWPHLASPDFQRLSRGASRWTWDQLADGCWRAAQAVLLIVAAGLVLWWDRREIVAWQAQGLAQWSDSASSLCRRWLFLGGAILAVLAAVDYAWQWRRREWQLRMTDQELRDDLRGDQLRRAPRVSPAANEPGGNVTR